MDKSKKIDVKDFSYKSCLQLAYKDEKVKKKNVNKHKGKRS